MEWWTTIKNIFAILLHPIKKYRSLEKKLHDIEEALKTTLNLEYIEFQKTKNYEILEWLYKMVLQFKSSGINGETTKIQDTIILHWETYIKNIKA